jgi:hypothetical protein
MFAFTGPSWFYGLDYYFELLAFLITLIIASYSLRIFTLTWDRKYLYFMLSFLAISSSYLIKAAMDWVIFRNLVPNVPNLAQAVSTVVPLPSLHSFVVVISAFLLLSGFLLLVSIYLGLKDAKMLFGLEGFLVVLTVFHGFIFPDVIYLLVVHLFLIIILMLIVIKQAQNFSRHKNLNTFLVAGGFSLIFLAFIGYFMIKWLSYMYGVGHVLQLAGYLMLLGNVILVLKK